MSHPLQEQQPPGMVLREMKGPAGGDGGRGRGGEPSRTWPTALMRQRYTPTDGTGEVPGRRGRGGVHPSPWGTWRTLEAGSGHHRQVCVQGEG